MTITNAKTLPKVYLGIHMAPGVAEYREPEGTYRILVNESTIKKMDPTFQGRPVYVKHVEEVNLDKIQSEADGYVVRSFYNNIDGKHWVEFIVVSDRGHEAIRNGWRLSNAYIPKEFGGGGLWHGVEYQKEVMNAEYEHLAIVNDPRYDESIILTPDQFKEYNEKKELELKRLTNSKGEQSVLTFFKKAKVENSLDVENTVVVLPESKVEKTIAQLVNEMDAIMNMHGYANMDHMVKVGEEEMSVKNLVSKHMKMCDEMKKMNEEKESEKEKLEEGEKKNADLDSGQEEGEKQKKSADKTDDKMENVDLDSGEKEGEKQKKSADKTDDKKQNEDAAGIEDTTLNKKKKNEFYDALKNAPETIIKDPIVVDLDKSKRGKERYGSGR